MSSVYHSSGSDNERRGGLPPPPPPPQYGQGRPPPKPRSRRKKRPLPPQEAINKIWSRFSAPRFSKATTLLPFISQPSSDISKTVHTSKSTPNNLLVSEDFERAVQECRTKVKKLIKECRRVNMRYRDPTFDLDWDLKWERGYCLNGLVDTKFEINGRNFLNPSSNVPKAVKRVHEIFDKPTFLGDKVSPADIKQGSLGDCWLMSGLTALANMQVGIQRICVEYDTRLTNRYLEIGIYGFVFHRDGEWIVSIVDDKLYLSHPDWDSRSVQRHLLEQTDREDVEKEYRKTYQTGSKSLFFANCKDPNETWLPLLEKAYAKAHGDYAALTGGWIGEGVEDLTGGVTTELLTSDILDIDEFWTNEIMKVNKEFLFGCSTGLLDGGYGDRGGISEGHAYIVMEARELSTGERLLKLRNPWGKGKKGNWEGAWSDGSKEFTPEAQLELNHKFGNDSVFWISFEDLMRKYQHFDRTRLFMDSPDWRITQQWISVEVPWHAEFEEKFRIVLKKESPVVLVFSQLDDRYFYGLQGQYSFRLQFRLHEVDSPGEEDYIVRSHGNYLMERSVVTELKSLGPGTYSVFAQVVADRDITSSSVEEVIKSQTRNKTDNDKLLQVGAMYDLAHRKGAVHLEARANARKAQDKAKAREARIAARKKNWERRHLSRDIVRKQDKKNIEKLERRDAKDAANAKKKDEQEPKDKAVQTEDVQEVQILKKDQGMQTGDVEDNIEETANENDKGVQTDFPSSVERTTSTCTPVTPNSSSDAAFSSRDCHLPGAPPPPFIHVEERRRSRRYSKHNLPPPPPPPQNRKQYYPSDLESSASPISDQDDMCSDDDPSLKPRPINTEGLPKPDPYRRGRDSDDDDEIEPWNAVCIVGLRVYSKDEDLEVKIFEEGCEQTLKDDEDGTDADVEDMAVDSRASEGLSAGDNTTPGTADAMLTKSETSTVTDRTKTGDASVLVHNDKEGITLSTEASIISIDGGADISASAGKETQEVSVLSSPLS